jgi:hypothetical protein
MPRYRLVCSDCGVVEDLPDVAAIAGAILAHLRVSPGCRGRAIEVQDAQLSVFGERLA